MIKLIKKILIKNIKKISCKFGNHSFDEWDLCEGNGVTTRFSYFVKNCKVCNFKVVKLFREYKI